MRYPANQVANRWPSQPVIRADLQRYKPTLVVLPGHAAHRVLTQGRATLLQGGLQTAGDRFVFDGTDDYITVSGGSLVSSTSHTLVAVCTLTASPTNYNNVAQYENSSGNNRYLFYTTDANYGDLSWGAGGSGGGSSADSARFNIAAITPVVGREHRLVLRVSSATNSGYSGWCNGIAMARSSTDAFGGSAGTTVIGRKGSGDADRYLPGHLKLFALFNAELPDALCAELSSRPQSLFQAPTRRIFIPAAGGSSGVVGLSTETDTAFALSGTHKRLVGLSTETDTALALSSRSYLAVGLSTEVDTSFALVPRTHRAAGLSTETDTAFALSSSAGGSVGLSLETDTAFALAARSHRPAGLSVETDTAFALAARSYRAVGLSLETDTSFALTARIHRVVGLSQETDTALALSPFTGSQVGTALETDTAFALAGRSYRAVGLSLEIDTAFALSAVLSRPVGLSAETDTSFSLASRSHRPVGLAVETDSALALSSGGVQITVKAGSWLRYRTI